VRVKPETSELTDAGAALLEADGTWGRLTLPQEDPFSRRAAYRSHSISYRDRARGFATDLFQGDDQLVEAIATLESGAARDVYLNVGAGVRRVWLNGERIYDNERWTGWHAGKDRIAVTLRAGVNRIVIESGDTFFVSVTDGRDWPLTPRTKGRRGR